MISELQLVTNILILLGTCSATFTYKEILSILGHCHATCLYMEPPIFFGRFVQKVSPSCFSDSFDQKTSQQSDGSCNVTIDTQLS